MGMGFEARVAHPCPTQIWVPPRHKLMDFDPIIMISYIISINSTDFEDYTFWSPATPPPLEPLKWKVTLYKDLWRAAFLSSGQHSPPPPPDPRLPLILKILATPLEPLLWLWCRLGLLKDNWPQIESHDQDIDWKAKPKSHDSISFL